MIAFAVTVGAANVGSARAGACFIREGQEGRDYFGADVAIEGSTAMISAPGDGGGVVHVYEFDGVNWQETQIVSASGGHGADRFGTAVSFSDDVMVVGAPFDWEGANEAGAAYIFRLQGTTWVQEQKLIPSDIAADDRFGRRAAINGDCAVVGSWFDDDDGDISGSAYVFRFNGADWTEEQKLTASDAQAGDRFGDAVGLEGETIVIGAYEEDDAGPNAGAAYVFRYDGANWAQAQKLTASDAQPMDAFGRSIAIDGDVMLIGARLADADAAADTGAVYVFGWDGANWVEQQKLTASDAAMSDGFTWATVDGDIALIGADQVDAAYVFERKDATWVEVDKLTPLAAHAGGGFGSAVALDGRTAMIGGNAADSPLTDSGVAYFRDLFHAPTTIDVMPGASIQAAVNRACEGDDIVIHPGVYPESFDLVGSSITVRSVDPQDPAIVESTTIAPSAGVGTVVQCAHGEVARVDGLTIAGATTSGMLVLNGANATVANCTFLGNTNVDPFHAGNGGGIYVADGSSLSATNCTFVGNTTPMGSGGGLYVADDSAASVVTCEFTANTASEQGGGMRAGSNVSVIGSTFLFNSASLATTYDNAGGGGLSCRENAFVSDSTFTGNSSAAIGPGGGLSCGAGSVIDNCIFDANTSAGVGGGISCLADASLTRCTFTDNATEDNGAGAYVGSGSNVSFCAFTGNRAEGWGGGVRIVAGSINHCSLAGNEAHLGGGIAQGVGLITQCTFSGNEAYQGGGVWVGSTEITNCTFSANTARDAGGGMYVPCCASTPVVSNTVFWANLGAGGVADEFFYPEITDGAMTYCDILGVVDAGNFYLDPLFIDADGADDVIGTEDDDLRLTASSPCIDAGDQGFMPSADATTDLDGHARVLCGRVDMGAYEFGIGDYDCDRDVNLLDFASWEACVTGPALPGYDAGCEAFDFDGDVDVDLADFSAFVQVNAK